MSKKILIYITEMWYCGHDFYAEIMYNNLKEGNEVYILKCAGALKGTCQYTKIVAPCESLAGCDNCLNSFNTMLKHYRIPSSSVIYFTDFSDIQVACIPKFQNVSELNSWKYKSIDIGAATYNLLGTVTYDHAPNTIEHADAIDTFISEGIKLYEYLIQILPTYSHVYFFNGRITFKRIPLRICQTHNIPCTSIEYGAGNTIMYYPNTYPQDQKLRQKYTKKLWESSALDLEAKKEIAQSFFYLRRTGQTELNYTFLQQKNQLPFELDKNKINIAIFDSTLLEVVGLEGFESRLDFLYYVYILANDLLEENNVQFYLRSHPTRSRDYTAMSSHFSPSTQARMIRILYHLNLKNLRIILPHDSTDTYALLNACDMVLTSGSAMGVEATFWGKPSIALGNVFFDCDDVAYYPKNYNELKGLLTTPNLQPKSQETCLPYGYHFLRAGEQLKIPVNWTWESITYFEKILNKLRKFKSFILNSFFSCLKKLFSKKKSPEFQKIQKPITVDYTEQNEFYATVPTDEEINIFLENCATLKKGLFFRNHSSLNVICSKKCI